MVNDTKLILESNEEGKKTREITHERKDFRLIKEKKTEVMIKNGGARR